MSENGVKIIINTRLDAKTYKQKKMDRNTIVVQFLSHYSVAQWLVSV